jgi:hypothetical protein
MQRPERSLFTGFYFDRNDVPAMLHYKVNFSIAAFLFANPEMRFETRIVMDGDQFLANQVLNDFTPVQIIQIADANHCALQQEGVD